MRTDTSPSGPARYAREVEQAIHQAVLRAFGVAPFDQMCEAYFAHYRRSAAFYDAPWHRRVYPEQSFKAAIEIIPEMVRFAARDKTSRVVSADKTLGVYGFFASRGPVWSGGGRHQPRLGCLSSP